MGGMAGDVYIAIPACRRDARHAPPHPVITGPEGKDLDLLQPADGFQREGQS